MASDPKLRPVKWDFDILRKEFIPRPDPLPVPVTGIFDDTLYCMQFNAMWMPHILGALELLLQKDSWSGGDSELFRAHQAIYTMLANVTICGEPMRIVELQSILIGDCNQLQWKYTDEPVEAWRNLGDPVCDGTDGTDGADGTNGTPGATGAKGDKGDPGDCPDCPEPNQPTTPTSDDEELCGIAVYLIDLLLALSDESTNALLAGQTAVQVAESFASIDPTGVTEALLSFLDTAIGFGIGAYQAAFTLQAKEDMKCDLYCVLKENGGVFNASSTWELWKTKHRSRGFNPAFEIFYSSINARITNWWNQRAAIGLRKPDAFCSVCACVDDILIGWELTSSTVNEMATNQIFKLKLTTPAPLAFPVTVNVVGIDGTATAAGNDYLIMTPEVTFPAGSSDGALANVEVFIPVDIDSTAETFTLRIDTVSGGTIDEPNKDHVVTVNSCGSTTTYTINCTNNNTFIPAWTGCGSGVTTHHGTQQITVTLPEVKQIKRIRVNWRSAFSPSAPIGQGKITVNGTTYSQNITGSGSSTSPQTVDNLYVNAQTFTIETTGTVNGTNPSGYVAYFSIIVEYCI